MFFFITFLRAVAACLITNAHYTGIYPTDLIANGGIIGDVIFFAVSGYCLANIKGSFPVWYSKRIIRCYLPIVVMTAVYTALHNGISVRGFADNWGHYPVFYHFVESIVLLYIIFYVVMYIKPLKSRLPLLMGVVAIFYLAVYIFSYDKSYYHIDSVYEPMVRFLFMESMLLGAYFRQNSDRYVGKFSFRSLVCSIVFFGIYIASKLFFVKFQSFAYLQVINQVVVFVLLAMLFRFFMGMENKLKTLPKFIKNIISFVSMLTLEIYVVQYWLIDLIRPEFSFPLNWIAITSAILVSAAVLHYVCEGILKLYYAIVNKIKKSTGKVKE